MHCQKFVVLLAFVLLAAGAAAQSEGHRLVVSARTASHVLDSEAILNAEITGIGEEETMAWFEYGETKEYGQSTEKLVLKSAGEFSRVVRGLAPNTRYNFRAVAENSSRKAFGSNRAFTTKKEGAGESVETAAKNAERWHNSAAEIEFECTAESGDCLSTFYSVGAGEWLEGNSVSISESGRHSIEFYSTSKKGGEERIKETWAGIDLEKPEEVSGLQAESTEKGIALNWNASQDADSGTVSYNIYRDGKRISGQNKTTYLDPMAEPGTAYEYSVSALDAAGNESETASVSVSVDEAFDEVVIEFIEPGEGTFSAETSEIRTIVVRVSSAEGEIITEDIEAIVSVDGIEESAWLAFSQADKTHAHDLQKPIEPGRHELEIEITESGLAGSAKIVFGFESTALDLSGLLPLVIGIVAIAAASLLLYWAVKKGKIRIPRPAGKKKKKQEEDELAGREIPVEEDEELLGADKEMALLESELGVKAGPEKPPKREKLRKILKKGKPEKAAKVEPEKSGKEAPAKPEKPEKEIPVKKEPKKPEKGKPGITSLLGRLERLKTDMVGEKKEEPEKKPKEGKKEKKGLSKAQKERAPEREKQELDELKRKKAIEEELATLRQALGSGAEKKPAGKEAEKKAKKERKKAKKKKKKAAKKAKKRAKKGKNRKKK